MRASLIVGLAVMALPGMAERIIIPPPPPPIPRVIQGLRPLSLEVDASVDGVRVVATYSLRFKNVSRVPAEGTILIPVPEGVAIERFTMRAGEDVLGGELLTADEARRIYEEIVRRRRDPALLSLVGDSALSVRVFPVPPGEERTLEVRWTGLLAGNAEEHNIRLPLRTSLDELPERVTVRVNIQTDVPLTTLYSPVPGVDITRHTSGSAVLRYETDGASAPFEWRAVFRTDQGPVGVTVIPYRQPGEDGYALILVSPGLPEEERRSPKNFVLVADTSGSMAGEKLRNLKDGAEFILKNLHPGDTFNIVAFESQVRLFEDAPVSFSEENVRRATAFLEGLEAVGSTNIHEALVRALALPRPERVPTYLLFITDGKPTFGVTNPEQILKAVAEKQGVDRARIFVLGVGLDVNVPFLDRIARENGGSSEYVGSGQELEQKMSDLYRKLQAPVITNVRLTLRGVRPYDIYPAESFDLFAGSQTVIALRYSGEGSSQISLEGTYRERPFRLTEFATFPARATENAYIARIWATRKIGALLDEVRLKGNSPELIDSIIQLSRKYGIMTPYTDFLILEPGIRPEEVRESVVHPLDLSAPGAAPSPEMTMKAQITSEALGRMAQAETAPSGDQRVKICGSRSLIHQNNRWEELSFAEAVRGNPTLETRKVVFLSDEYFQLVRDNPDLKECFATAPYIVLKIGDTWYEIVETQGR